MKYKVLLLFFAMVSCYTVFGQSQILNEYVERGIRNNLDVRATTLDRIKQEIKIEQAAKLWLPSVDLSTTYLLAEGGRTINFPVGDLFNPAYATLNQLTMSNSFPTDLENVETQLTPTNFIDAQINVTKPLINSSIRFNQKIQTELLALTQVDQKLTEQEVAFNIRTAYFNHLQSVEALSILGESENLLNQVLDFNRKLVRFDKATMDIVSDVEFQIEALRSQRATLLEQNEMTKRFFNLLINEPLESDIIIDPELRNIDIDDHAGSLQSWIEQAKQNRLEYGKINKAVEINQLSQDMTKSESQPELAIFGGVGLQTESFDFNDGGPLFTLGLGLKMNLFDGGMRNKRVEELTVDREILENDKKRLNQKVQIEVANAYYGLLSVYARYQAQLAAEENATVSFNLINTKYENNKALLIELLQAQNKLTLSRMEKSVIKYQYLIKRAELLKALGSNI